MMSAPTRHRVARQAGSPGERVFVNVGLVVVALFFGAPFLWILASAFDGAPRSNVPWPREPTFDNVRYLFDELDVGVAIKNSLIVSTATMVLVTVSASLAGFGLSRWRFRGKTGVAYGVLLLQTVPLAATMVPLYDLARRLDLYDTYRGLILTHTALSLPFLVWLMKGFYDAAPVEVEEAAWLDGAGKLRAWFGVLLPLTRPGIAVAAGYSFLTAWAEVLLAVILVRTQEMATIPFAFFFAADGGEDVQVAAALALLYLLPVLVLFVALRKVMVSGVAGTAMGDG